MARNMQMMPSTGRGVAGKVVAFLIVVALLTLLVHDPIGFAHAVRSVFAALGAAADTIDTFSKAL